MCVRALGVGVNARAWVRDDWDLPIAEKDEVFVANVAHRVRADEVLAADGGDVRGALSAQGRGVRDVGQPEYRFGYTEHGARGVQANGVGFGE